jgi:N-acetylglutamate synthase-like GNAT family acetyltransferase
MILSTVQPIELAFSDGRISAFVSEADDEGLIDYLAEHTDMAIQVAALLSNQSRRVAVLNMISVAPERRLRGVGNRLMNQFLETAESKGATAILLIAEGTDDHASDFNLSTWFQSFGFTSVEGFSQAPLMVFPESIAQELEEEL